MEWVEVTAKTVDEAKDLALDRLGIDAEDAEFEVLEEPRAGLFGRVRGEGASSRPSPTGSGPSEGSATGSTSEGGRIRNGS